MKIGYVFILTPIHSRKCILPRQPRMLAAILLLVVLLMQCARPITLNIVYSPSPADAGIGATDEYFANTYQIPSYTMELEPANSGADYGGFGVSHDGFILPNSEVARMRDETAAEVFTGLYMIAAFAAFASANYS